MHDEKNLLLQQQIASLEKAMADGVLEVWYGERRVRYRSVDEIMQILTRLKHQLPQKSLSNNHAIRLKYYE